jgi:hypothetical protein
VHSACVPVRIDELDDVTANLPRAEAFGVFHTPQFGYSAPKMEDEGFVLAAEPALIRVVEEYRTQPVVREHGESACFDAPIETLEQTAFSKDSDSLRMDPLPGKPSRSLRVGFYEQDGGAARR